MSYLFHSLRKCPVWWFCLCSRTFSLPAVQVDCLACGLFSQCRTTVLSYAGVSVFVVYSPVILSYAGVSVFVVYSPCYSILHRCQCLCCIFPLLFCLTQVSASLLYVPQAKAIKYEQALGKINEAFGSIAEFRREVSELTPKHKAATDSVHTLVEFVEQQKQDYIQVMKLHCVL